MTQIFRPSNNNPASGTFEHSALNFMKTNKLNWAVALVCTAVALSTFTGLGAVSSKAIERILSSVRAPELPAKAASLVSKAAIADREETTIAVVKAAIQKNPAAAAAVVGAIAHSVPKMAAIAASTAVSLEPKQASKIARAASSGAPAEREKIVAAMSKEAPAQSTVISQAVTFDAPRPTLLDNGFSPAPHVGPPFVPRTNAAGQVNNSNTVIVTNRDYSSP